MVERPIASRAACGGVAYRMLDSVSNVSVKEDSRLVDGIGGVLWDGAFVLNAYLERLFLQLRPEAPIELHVIELGCGAALTSKVLHTLASTLESNQGLKLRITATDRFTDLAVLNCGALKDVDFAVVELDWESPEAASAIVSSRGKADIVVGAEIMVLIKQQIHLMAAIGTLSHASTLTLLTADGAVPSSKYEALFCDAMRRAGFGHAEVARGCVTWSSDLETESKTAMLKSFVVGPGLLLQQDTKARGDKENDETGTDGGCWRAVMLPPPQPLLRVQKMGQSASQFAEAESEKPLPVPPPSTQTIKTADAELTTHRVLFFCKNVALRTCKNCHGRFVAGYSNAFNVPELCRFHPLLFVKRWHPSEVSLDCGHGDREGYYGGGTKDYRAEFWDCCGSEDKSNIGCQTTRCHGYI